MSEKLHKVLARAGVGSRRAMEEWISSGRVKVNGEIATLGDRVSANDRIEVDGRVIPYIQEHEMATRVLLYFKPEGLVCTRSDPQGRPTIFEQLPPLDEGRWVAVGRLDLNSQGLMLLTNEGELANRLMHPSSNIEREYAVRVLGDVHDHHIETLKAGVMLEDGPANFDEVIAGAGEGANQWYHVLIRRGRKREVRRLWESVGFKVSRLIRVRFGELELPRSMQPGESMELDEAQIEQLKQLSGSAPQSRTGLYGRARFRNGGGRPTKPTAKTKHYGYLRRRR